nr:hypothetical protein [Tanacetum cinerariifolium]
RKKKTKKPKRKDIELPQTSVPTEVVADKAVYEEMYDSVERAATTATSLDAEHDMGIISKTQFTAILNEPSSIGTSSGSGPKRQETMGDAVAQTRSERVSKFSNEPPLLRVNTLGSGEDRLKLQELMELYTKLSEKVLNLETTKTAQAFEKESQEIGEEKEVKNSWGRNIADIDGDAKTILVDETTEDQGSTRHKARGVVMQEPSETPTTTTIPKSLKVQDKRKMKKKDQINFDEQEARSLQVEIDEQDRLAEEKAQLIKDENLAWDNVQAMMDADCKLAARLQEEE